MKPESKQASILKSAYFRGYRVTPTGEVVSPYGVVRKLRKSSARGTAYLVFNLKDVDSDVRRPVRVHQLAAYQKFGDAVFDFECVRHLDGNSLNNRPDNLELGSHHDNSMDRPAEDRSAHASRGQSGKYAWDLIEEDYNSGMGFKQLRKKYGVSAGTLSAHFNKIPGWSTPDNEDQFDWKVILDYIIKNQCTYKEASNKFGCSTRACYRRLGPRKNIESTASV